MNSCTVVIPAFNPDPDALNTSLARLLLAPWAKRIIIVDDGSDPPLNDQTGPLAAARVEVIRQDNAGVSAARNTGIDYALRHDEPVLFLDADDEIRDGAPHAIDLLREHRASAVVSAREERAPSGEVTTKPVPAEWTGKTLPHPGDVFRPIALFGASGVVASRAILDAGLRFDTALSHGEDRDFLRRAAEVGGIVVNPHPALMVRLHERAANNLTSAAHDVRRAHALATLVERWCDDTSEPHFRASARWLLNRVAKRGSHNDAWRTLIELHRSRGWQVSWKACVRRLFTPGVS
ncbi:MAG: glycosyltransferase family 2 protein [Planctomycetota bacterium]